MAKGIPPKLEQDVIGKAAEGLTTRQIAAWLKEHHAVVVSHVAVARLLKKGRPERERIAREVVREVIGDSVAKDLKRLEKFAAKLAQRANVNLDDEVFCKLVDQLRKVTETKLSHAGLAGADRNGLPALQAEKLRAEIELLKKRAAEDTPPAEPSLEEETKRLDALRARYPELRTLPGDDVHEDA